jgi:hypothetical protein
MAADKDKPTAAYTLPCGNEPYTDAVTLTTANSPASVTINGGGRVITGNGNGIIVGAGVTLTIKNITFTKIQFTMDGGGKLMLDTGAVVRENSGTGVTLNNGFLEMLETAFRAFSCMLRVRGLRWTAGLYRAITAPMEG